MCARRPPGAAVNGRLQLQQSEEPKRALGDNTVVDRYTAGGGEVDAARQS